MPPAAHGPEEECASQVASACAMRLWVSEIRRVSCDLLILVDEAAEAVVSLDLVDLGCCATGESSWAPWQMRSA